MIIEFYHGYMTLERLHDMLGITRIGTTAYQLIETAKELGFHAYGIELNRIDEQVFHLPAIAHIQTKEGFYHYVVIYEIHPKKGTILMADPSVGITTITFDVFQELWTNHLFLFYPIRTLPILDQKYKLYDFIVSIIKQYSMLLFKVMVLSLFYGVFATVVNFYVTIMVNSLSEQSKSLLWIIFGMMLVLYILKNMTDYFRNRILLLFHERMTLFLVLDILKRLIFLPYKYYQNRTTGEILSKVNELLYLQSYIEKWCTFLSFDVILCVISFCILFRIDANLLFIHILVLLCDFLIWMIWKKSYTKRQYRLQVSKAMANQTMTEVLMGYETIKGLHLEKHVIARLTRRYLHLIKDDIDYQLLRFRHQLFRLQLHDITYAISIFSLAVMLLDSKHTISDMITFQTFTGYFIMAITKGSELILSHQQVTVALEQLSFLFQKKEKVLKILRTIKGSISFQNFRYELEHGDILFEDCTVKFPCYSKTLLLGESGSGKSTLAKVIMKYEKIQPGQVYIDGIDLLNYSEDSISQSIIYMNQFGTLFTDTIYNNIVLNRKVNADMLDDILKICAIDKILIKRGTDLSMRLEENGMNLSGGERQRILLARALLSPFDIFIIDEGLSQVDKELEEQILKHLFLKYYNKTIIVISHRREYPALFHQILEIKNKKIEVIT